MRNQQRLEFKFNKQAAPEHLYCTERVFSLASGARQVEEMNSLFAGFLPRWSTASTVSKALRVNGLIEIETQCAEESETRQAVEQVQAFAAGVEARQVHVGYVELWLQKYHPLAYRQGQYQEGHSSSACS